jgi:hypothetical protein
MACPPRGTVPVNPQAWFREAVSPQHTRFAFGQGCDCARYYVARSFPKSFPVGKRGNGLPASYCDPGQLGKDMGGCFTLFLPIRTSVMDATALTMS